MMKKQYLLQKQKQAKLIKMNSMEKNEIFKKLMEKITLENKMKLKGSIQKSILNNFTIIFIFKKNNYFKF